MAKLIENIEPNEAQLALALSLEKLSVSFEKDEFTLNRLFGNFLLLSAFKQLNIILIFFNIHQIVCFFVQGNFFPLKDY